MENELVKPDDQPFVRHVIGVSISAMPGGLYLQYVCVGQVRGGMGEGGGPP